MDWINTKAGLQMAETIIRYLPRIVACLEEISKDRTESINSEIGKAVKEIEEVITMGDKKLRNYYSKFGDDEEDSEGIIPSSDVEYENYVYEREELRCKEK